MMILRAALLISLLLTGLSSQLLAADSVETVLSAFRNHCVQCHGSDGTTEGDVDLAALKTESDLRSHPELLEDLIKALEDRAMPPEGELSLPDKTRQMMARQLRSTLRQVQTTLPFEPTPIRRMNRFQYNNAVMDLLELDRQIFQLNERLLRRRNDYFHPDTKKMPDQVRVSTRPLSKDIDNQRPEGFRGVAAFPQDQRAEHGFDNRADHLTLSPLLMESFLQLSQTIAESPDLNPQECRSWDDLFAPPGKPARGPVEGRYEGEQPRLVRITGIPKGRPAPQDMRGFGNGWSGNSQLFWRCTKKDLELTVSFDVRQPGTGLHFGLTKAPDYGTFDIYLDDTKLGDSVDLYDPRVVPSTHDVSVKINAGQHTLKFKCVGRNETSTRYFFGLDFVDVTGREPLPEATGTRLSDKEAIRIRLNKLLRRAFRRPVEPETLKQFEDFASHQLESGKSFEDTMRAAVGAVLGMPDFLYFYESGTPTESGNETNGRQRVSDFDLASRLSQFFWSSLPDDTLLDLAEAGKLSDPETLSAQIDRMLNDRRSSRFCDNFPGQWLQLDRLVTAIPDQKKFPYFYYNGYRSSLHMMPEPLLLFETVFVEDRSIMDLIDPDFSWQSSMLQANYEGHRNAPIDVQVQTFRRVPLDDPRRGGVITNAAIMTMTSTPTRTQPITRGAWLNSVIFNDPPEPPPADVPPLPEVDQEELKKLTIRERLAVHRQRSDCAGCHNQIDPLGFALENYGPTGIWRDKYENGRKVDVSGILFNQHEFTTLTDFKQLLLQERHRFVRGFVAHLLSYALGRELGPADSPALDDMTAQAVNGNDSLRTVMKRVAMSEPFLHKNIQARQQD